ncbi:MAG: hypothetical protein ACRYGL_00160 [Janthinobacterium lividum]
MPVIRIARSASGTASGVTSGTTSGTTSPSPSPTSHAAWRTWLASLPQETCRPAVDLAARARTTPATVLGYTLSTAVARLVSGYDDVQLSMADALLNGRRVASGPMVPPHGRRAAPCGGNVLLSRVLGEEPFCTLSALIAHPRFGLTMDDLRVATFHPTHGGRLAAYGLSFLMVTPGVARFFDHEGQDCGRELDAVAGFIDARRDTVLLIDAVAPERERLLAFGDCAGPVAVRERLLTLCWRASDSFRQHTGALANGADAGGPTTRVMVSSREASFGLLGQPLHFPSLAARRALHRLPDRSMLLPPGWPRAVVTAPGVENAGEAAGEAAQDAVAGMARRRLAAQKDQIAAFGFADLGLRSARLPVRPAPPPRSRPAVLRSIHDELRAAAAPVLRSLDETARQARAARAAGIAGASAPDWTALEGFAQRTAGWVRTILTVLQEGGARGGVDALCLCLGVLRRFDTPLLDAVGSQANLSALVTLARWRLEDVAAALTRVAFGESPPGGAAAPSRHHCPQYRVLNEACVALFPGSTAATGRAVRATGDAMTPTPFGELARAIRGLHDRSPVADMPVADMPVADMPVADVPVADMPANFHAEEIILANIDAWLEDVHDLLFLRTPDAVHGALLAMRRLEEATRLLTGGGPAVLAVLAAVPPVTRLLESTLAKLQHLDAILAR